MANPLDLQTLTRKLGDAKRERISVADALSFW